MNLPTIIIYISPLVIVPIQTTRVQNIIDHFCLESREMERSPARHGFVSVGSEKSCFCRVEIWEKGDISEEEISGYFLSTFLNSASSTSLQMLLCRRMLGLNPGLMRLWHWQSDALTNPHP